MVVQFFFMWFMIILTLILLMYAFSLEYSLNLLLTYPVPQCYNDWLCKQNIDGQIVEVNMAQNTLFGTKSALQMCTPLNSDNICNFTYTNQDGVLVTEQPGTYINTWADVSGCSSSNNYEGCPFYTVGDIYWRACYNNIEGNSYNNYNRTYFNQNQNFSLCQ